MSASPWVAWPSGADPATLGARVRAAHDAFLAGGAPDAVRPVVLDSWRRSRRSGVDPERPAVVVDLADDELARRRRDHPLAPLLPIVRRLLVEDAESEGLVVALGDADGRLLWVEGDRSVRTSLGRAGFVEGATWHESVAGTSAPGIALATDHEVQVYAAEHFACAIQPWSCSAAPVHAPDGRVLGVLDLTGRDGAASPLALSLVRSTVAAMESELAARALRDLVGVGRGARPRRAPEAAATDVPARLEVLGRAGGSLRRADDDAVGLGLRHSELLLLLATQPDGWSADGLALALHPTGLSDVTVRAEVSRLRRVVGDLLGGSRPYRLAAPLVTDLAEVRALLDAGDVAGAVRSYPGPVLPRSQAPGVVALRDELDAELRAAVEHTDDVEAVLAWTLHPSGADDWAAWRRLTGILPAGSPAAARARARLLLLDRRLGTA
ncbi:transcriptional regulator [Actinotalea sp. AC32]|nr:transcriptional regulator [Actinotalea sp. AC32]